MHKTIPLMALGCLLLSTASPAQHAAIFRGQGTGNVEVIDPTKAEPTQRPSELQGVSLLPIDFVGRTQIDALRNDRPRLRADLPGASRIVLPRQRGSLYRFARDEGAAGTVFGFFRVSPTGVAEVVFERFGHGPGNDQDPFVARIAVAPRGDVFLAATVSAAGGDLFEVHLFLGPPHNRTELVPPQDFSDAGLLLSDAMGVAVSTSGVWRFERSSSSDARAVGYAGAAPTFWSGELALSDNGLYAVTTAGTGAQLLDVWTFGVSGPAMRVSSEPMRLSGAGYLPESLHGPYLAVSDDGAQCAWRREAIQEEDSREGFLAFAAPPPGAEPTQISADPFYVDTLDEVGQFFFRGVFGLIMAVGEREAGTGEIEGIDLYSVRLDPSDGSPSFTNITLSSGDPDIPFEASSLDPEYPVRVPQANALLFADNETDRLVAMIEGQSGTQLIMNDVKALDRVEAVGERLLVHLRRESGDKPRQVHDMPASLSGAKKLVFSSDSADEINRPAQLDERWYAFVEQRAASQFVYRYDRVSGDLRLMTGRSFVYGDSLGYTSHGHLVLTVGFPGANALFLGWQVDGFPQRLKPATLPGFVLPAD